MNKYFKIVIVMFITLTYLNTTNVILSNDDLKINPIHQARKAIVEVINLERNCYGSGVVIDSDLVITAKHVVSGAEEVMIIFHDDELMTGVVAFRHRFTDLAIIILEKKTSVKPVKLVDSKPDIGTTVYCIGNPAMMQRLVQKKLISGYTKFRLFFSAVLTDIVYLDSGFISGFSGGGVFDSEGNLISIVTGSISQRNNSIGVTIYIYAIKNLKELIKWDEAATEKVQVDLKGLKIKR